MKLEWMLPTADEASSLSRLGVFVYSPLHCTVYQTEVETDNS
jgi:hypothetical protein